MKLRLLILLAAALAASPAAGQTIKSLGYNTTNGQVVYSGTNTLRMPDQVKFGTNSAGIVSGSQYLTLLDGGGGVALQLGTNRIIAYDAIDFGGVSGTALSNAATTRTNLGLGETNTVTFSNIQLGLFGTASATGFVGRTSGGQFALYGTNVSSSQPAFFGWDGFNNAAMSAGTSRTNLGLGATNDVTFSNVTVSGTFAGAGNVTLSGVNNTMPNATNAASGSSLMTRGLGDLRLFAQLALLDQIRSDMGTVHATNGGGGAIDVNGFDLTTSTNSASSSLYRGYFGSKQTLSGTGGNTVWQGRVVAAWAFNRYNTNVEVRMQFGRNQSVTNHGPLDERGMGIRVNGNNMFFETHDGTTHFETTNAVALTHNFGPDVFWAVSESGVARFYRGESTLLATVTNNVPTTFSAAAQRWVISISNTSTVSSGFRVRANPGYILQQ